MAGYYVESVFEHAGLKCAVLLQHMGHRCGYIAVPKSHPLYGNNWEKVERILDVHGGITFTSDRWNKGHYPIETDEDLWWFGFDCAHAGDAMDYDAVISEMPELTAETNALRRYSYTIPGDTIKTQEYVENECRRLAEQLRRIDMKLDEKAIVSLGEATFKNIDYEDNTLETVTGKIKEWFEIIRNSAEDEVKEKVKKLLLEDGIQVDW